MDNDTIDHIPVKELYNQTKEECRILKTKLKETKFREKRLISKAYWNNTKEKVLNEELEYLIGTKNYKSFMDEIIKKTKKQISLREESRQRYLESIKKED